MVGLYKIYQYLKYTGETELYNCFSLFPLLSDNHFLDFLKNKKAIQFSKIINNYAKTNDMFWVDYLNRYKKLRDDCYDSIYIGISMEVLVLNNGKIKISEEKPLILPSQLVNSEDKVLIKFCEITKNLNHWEILEIMNVGEYCVEN